MRNPKMVCDCETQGLPSSSRRGERNLHLALSHIFVGHCVLGCPTAVENRHCRSPSRSRSYTVHPNTVMAHLCSCKFAAHSGSMVKHLSLQYLDRAVS